MNVDTYREKLDGLLEGKLGIFKEMLIEYNQRFNLTSITDEKEIYEKHFLDSVAGESFFPSGVSCVEIGSGGGFPSLPLKILREDLSFTLVESTAKKCGYLQAVVDRLELSGVKVKNSRAEELAKEPAYREKLGIATARAVARLNVLTEYCLPFVKVGGRFIAYKGECEEELKEAQKAISLLGGEVELVEGYTLAGGDVRNIVVIKKVKPTPAKYPRGQGRERKCPII